MPNDKSTLTSVFQRRPGTHLDQYSELQSILREVYAAWVTLLNPDHARICQVAFMKDINGLPHENILAYVTVDGQPWDQPDVGLGVILCNHNMARVRSMMPVPNPSLLRLDFDPPPESCSLREQDEISLPSLYNLAATVIAFHNCNSPGYTLLHQCYWSVAMFYYTPERGPLRDAP
ncbi:hypothetical protein FKP32DRAFT_1600115 [Trametes sanguinea]|nr:hypothetical protein FKP32DRAFT_1600115 [Trametes sanguinea]